MKFFSIAVSMVLGLAASPAWSIIIDGNDVGSVDNIVAVTSNLNSAGQCGNGSNPTVEECWAENVASIDLIFAVKNETVPVIYDVSGDIGAFMLADNPEYYIVKNSQTWILMQNVDKLGWGVIDITDSALAGFQVNLGNLTVSHVTEFNGGEGEVSEPLSLALLGAGIVGFGLSRRRSSKKSLN